MATNTKFINSDNIKVFPCGGRDSKYDVTAKLTTEYNLASIINRLVDLGSFVVSNSPPAAGNDFLFNIGGYLFSISDPTFNKITDKQSITKGCYIAAYINPDNYINNEMTYMLLSPLNATSNAFTTSPYGGILDEDFGTSGNPDLCFTGIEFVLIPLSDIPANEDGLTVNKHTFEYIPKSSTSATDGVISVTNIQLPLLLYNGSSWVIPPDSKIKFRTTTDGSSRSVAIDDGELT